MFASFLLAAAMSIPPCWTIFETALQHSAASAHPAYVSYDEGINVTEDDQRLVQTTAHVDYRDDGLALVRDERFNYEPILTRHTEPGPPELGPYGPAREAWLPNRESWLPQGDVFPTIAKVRSQADMHCTVAGIEQYKGHTTYHLVFPGPKDRPAMKALWVDTSSDTIWKVIVSGYVTFADDPQGPHPVANFEVELGYSGPYLMVNHVVWAYSRHEYSQVSDYFGEYTFNSSFLPAGAACMVFPRHCHFTLRLTSR